MGRLHYGDHAFDMDDRLLAHLQLIIGVKLRRGENFFMSWKGASHSGDTRHAVWIDNGVPVYCEYEGGHEPKLNLAWAEKLADLASKGGGLIIQAEDIPMMTPEEPEEPTVSEAAGP